METDLIKQANDWVASATPFVAAKEYYCETRDVFQARLDRLLGFLLSNSELTENDSYMLSAIVGEIGNNSFDHNLGHWKDIAGIFFGYEFNGRDLTIVLADRGQGVLNSLKSVKPELEDDLEALETAFNEKISGRAPEDRGNGLKFVKASIKNMNWHLTFRSGAAQAVLNEQMNISAAENINGCLAIIKR